METTLSTLPPECLVIVTEHLVGGNVLRLWCTGSYRLQQNMINGGVMSMRLYDDWENSYSRIPRALPEFRHLRSLTISRTCHHLESASSVRAMLQQLPPTITRLHLTFAEAEECLFEPLEATQPANSPEEAPRNISAITTTPSKRKRTMWNLAQHFPSLSCLEVDSLFHFFRDEHIKALPRSLKQLSLPTQSGILSSKLFAFLPPDLTSLSLPVKLRAQLEDLALLPDGISSILLWNDSTWNETLKLPSALETLSIQNVDVNQSSLSYLPSSLTTLDITVKKMEAVRFEHLPRSLTSLNVGISSNQRVCFLVPEILASFPRTLKHCALYMFVMSSRTVAFQKSDWPPGLESFFCGEISMELDFIESMPSTITKFHTDSLSIVDAHKIFPPGMPRSAQLLPILPTNFPHLRDLQLHLQNYSPAEIEPLALSLPLPSTLTKLVIREILLINSSFWTSLPNSLTYLECHNDLPAGKSPYRHETYVSGFEFVPRRLETLILYGGNPALPSSEIRHLPPTLTDFSTSLAIKMTMEDVRALPSGLKKLNLTGGGLTESSAIPLLPRGLRYLSLKLYPVLHPEDLQALPAGLEEFHGPNLELLEDFHMALLPRSLRILQPTNANRLTEKALAYLPIPLRVSAPSKLLRAFFNFHRMYLNPPLTFPDPRVAALYHK